MGEERTRVLNIQLIPLLSLMRPLY
jgi:hypothetical protein